MTYLQVENLNKSFGDKVALNNISFSLEKNQTLTIIGNSGSGKTTLLRILAFLETKDFGIIYLNGNVFVDNEPLTASIIREKRKSFGLVFQGYNLFPHLSVYQNLMLPIKEKFKQMKLSKIEYKKKIFEAELELESLMETLNISELKKKYPSTLSGGEAQRVAIVRALALKPDIMLFDEPTSALDPKLKKTVAETILKLKEMGTTMIVVTHEMEFAKEIADSFIYLENGNIIEAGDKEGLFNPKTKELISFLE